MDNIRVSVIVPIYNTEKYLEECLSSLEKQTLKDIEVILVNDGSTDDSGIIAKEYADRNENFILIERENGGLSAARNTGLGRARGEYVYFLDSDDYLVEYALERIYMKAQQDDLDVLKFSAYTFEEPSRELSWTSDGGYKYKGKYKYIYRGMDALQMFIDNNDNIPNCGLIFTKRETIVKNNLYFYEGIVYEDNLFHLQLLSLSDRVEIMNEPLHCRRYRAGSITQAPNYRKKSMSMCISAEAADRFLEKHPQVKGETVNWYVMFFIYEMLTSWEKMTKEEQKSSETRDWFMRVKPIAKKYGNGGNIALRIFYLNTSIYKLFLKLMAIVK